MIRGVPSFQEPPISFLMNSVLAPRTATGGKVFWKLETRTWLSAIPMTSSFWTRPEGKWARQLLNWIPLWTIPDGSTCSGWEHANVVPQLRHVLATLKSIWQFTEDCADDSEEVWQTCALNEGSAKGQRSKDVQKSRRDPTRKDQAPQTHKASKGAECPGFKEWAQ